MKFEVPIEPLPQSRPRFGRGKVFEPARMKSYKAAIKEKALAIMAGNAPITNAVKIKLKLFRKFKATSKRFGDADNLAKAIMDACNGVVWKDDAQIVSLTAEKFQGLPRVEVEIETFEDTLKF